MLGRERKIFIFIIINQFGLGEKISALYQAFKISRKNAMLKGVHYGLCTVDTNCECNFILATPRRYYYYYYYYYCKCKYYNKKQT